MADRAILFIDGNNWYHAVKGLAVRDLFNLDYERISRKLVGPRVWLGTRYYIGQVSQEGNPRLYADQRRFLAKLKSTHPNISVHLGRLESRSVANQMAREVREYLQSLPIRIDKRVFHRLMEIATSYRETQVQVEKAVDVMIAVDMVTMAEREDYEAAYLLSADGDFTPAVKAVRATGKKVYACSPDSGAQLASVANAFIRVDRDWFSDCYC